MMREREAQRRGSRVRESRERCERAKRGLKEQREFESFLQEREREGKIEHYLGFLIRREREREKELLYKNKKVYCLPHLEYLARY